MDPAILADREQRRAHSSSVRTAYPSASPNKAPCPGSTIHAAGPDEVSSPDNGNEFRAGFDTTLARLDARHTRIRAGRPQPNGHVENRPKTIPDQCWRPSFAPYLHITYGGLPADLAEYPHLSNTDHAHTGRLTNGRIPIDIIHPAHKMRPRA